VSLLDTAIDLILSSANSGFKVPASINATNLQAASSSNDRQLMIGGPLWYLIQP
jgi:hypothetical protein